MVGLSLSCPWGSSASEVRLCAIRKVIRPHGRRPESAGALCTIVGATVVAGSDADGTPGEVSPAPAVELIGGVKLELFPVLLHAQVRTTAASSGAAQEIFMTEFSFFFGVNYWQACGESDQQAYDWYQGRRTYSLVLRVPL
jgi:hypothetical protein